MCVVSGLAVVRSVYHNKAWLCHSRSSLLSLTFVMFLSVNLLYLAMLLLNMDPNWSLSLALQWCEDPAWVDTRSSSFTALMTWAGAGLGLAVGLTSPLSLRSPPASLSWPALTAGLLMSGAVGASALVIQTNLSISSRPVLHLTQLVLTGSSVYTILTQTARIQALLNSIVTRDRLPRYTSIN